MKTTHLNDEQLRRLLRQGWTVSPRPDPGFRAAVWARIEAGRRQPANWFAWLKVHVASVTLYAAASIAFVGTSGGLLATRQAGHDREQLIQRYVTSIDPHQRVDAEGRP